MLGPIKTFFQTESAASLMLLIMAVLAMVAANSPLQSTYETLHSPTVTIAINDGLMSLFFLCVGIEIRQEIRDGSLSAPGQVLLPAVAALGGIITPAVIYSMVSWNGESMRGWAIPTATDIALSLGILNLFRSSIPSSLRIFLMAIAIFDDLAAIVIVAIFYTQEVQGLSLFFAFGCIVLTAVYARYVRKIAPYLFIGAALWIALFDAGVSPTLSGVVLGLFLPSDLGRRVLHFLHGWVSLVIVPLFIFVNSGVPLESLYYDHLSNRVSLGIASGLFFGKQLGIFFSASLLIRAGRAKLPLGTSWLQLYAVCVLSGIGFTMSLFIGSLAFHNGPLALSAKAGVLMGSLASAAAGIICMALSQNCNNSKT